MPREDTLEALCLTFAASKFCTLTRIDSGDPVPNVLAPVKASFWVTIPEIQLRAATHVSERFVPMVRTSR